MSSIFNELDLIQIKNLFVKTHLAKRGSSKYKTQLQIGHIQTLHS